jgi:hypothetical protein
VVERIRQRLQLAGDDDLELLPAPEDIYGVLVYVRVHERFLHRRLERLERIQDPDDRVQSAIQAARAVLRDNALDRLLLVRRLRQLADVEEDKALDTARASKVTWRELAGLLGVKSAGGAELRHKRLKLAISSGWAVRTPRIAKKQAAEEAEVYERVAAGHQRVRQAALNLLEHRTAFPVVEDLDDWWDGLAEQLDGLDDTPAGQASARAHLGVIVTDLADYAAAAGAGVRFTPEAELAMRDAVAALGEA